ncbi:glycosyltransferase [Paenibacillus sepulcri]|uniref:Glycosyltransferase n=1 Tax=Paenibacillus sepulcri TaxID=359917 RepID=A0ABS7C5M8_9BACL|nr:glycosyltransferase [Paenibacillus sepulcri]
MHNDKILILTGNYGDGHQQAAAAVSHSLKLGYPQAETVIVDVMDLTHPYFHSIGRYLFLQSLKKVPSMYGYLYRKTRHVNSLSDFLKKLNRFGEEKLLDLIESMRPSVVVSTFPGAAGLMSLLKSHGLTEVPTVTVMTDYTVHSYWVYPFTDLYIVGSDEVKQGLIRHHIPGESISVTGIPLRLEFSQRGNLELLRRKHHLDDGRPTLLFMGGGDGFFGEGPHQIEALESLADPIQVIIICGHNHKLKQQLTEKFKSSSHKVLILGYIDYVHELMAVADLLVTKAGGLTISEALNMELPMIVFKPLPGQEEDNVNYLLRSGTALLANSTRDLGSKIRECFSQPSILGRMREQAREIAKRQAATDAADMIWKLRYQSVQVQHG